MSRSSRIASVSGSLGAGAVIAFGIFWLPFWFPPATVSMGPSYAAGFDNHVSVLVAGLSSLAVLVFFYLLKSSGLSGLTNLGAPAEKFHWTAGLLIGAAFLCVYALIAWVVCLSPYKYLSDPEYFLGAADRIATYGKHPYSDFEFAYGPLLAYTPAWIHHVLSIFGVSLEASMFLWALILIGVGLVVLLWNIRLLIPDRTFSILLFVAIAVCAFDWLIGMHQSFLRFLGPGSAILGLRYLKSFSRRFIYLAVCAFLLPLLSPELALAFLVGCFFYAVVEYASQNRGNLLLFLAPLIGTAVALPLFGADFLRTFASFAKGHINYVIVPYPLMICYLLALILIVPMGVAAVFRSKFEYKSTVAGYYGCALTFLPAALGAANHHHVFINGSAMFLLAFAHLQAKSRRLQYTALTLFTASAIVGPIAFTYLARHTIAHVAYGALSRFLPQSRFQTEDTQPATLSVLPPNIHRIGAPWDLDKATFHNLAASGRFEPSYFLGTMDIYCQQDEQKQMDSLSNADALLVPASEPIASVTKSDIVPRIVFPVTYSERRKPYQRGLFMREYVRSHFHLLEADGGYLLMARNKVSVISGNVPTAPPGPSAPLPNTRLPRPPQSH